MLVLYFLQMFSFLFKITLPPHLESKHLVRGLHAPHVGPLVRVDGDEEGFEQDVAVLEIAEVLRDDLKVIRRRRRLRLYL